MASEKITKLIEEVKELTVLELSELVKELEEVFGVSASAPAMMVAGPAAGDGGGAEEQSEFDVILDSPGSKKLAVLKLIREVTGLGLKEAKELVDNTPKAVKEAVSKEEAEELKAKIEAEGGKVTVK